MWKTSTCKARHLAMSMRPDLESWLKCTACSSSCKPLASRAFASTSLCSRSNSRFTAGSSRRCRTCTSIVYQEAPVKILYHEYLQVWSGGSVCRANKGAFRCYPERREPLSPSYCCTGSNDRRRGHQRASGPRVSAKQRVCVCIGHRHRRTWIM